MQSAGAWQTELQNTIGNRTPRCTKVTQCQCKFAGQHLEAQFSQSQNNGNRDVRWERGAACTANAEGLWDCMGKVSAEGVRHMQSRARQFEALAPLPQETLCTVPKCRGSFRKWLVDASACFATRSIPVTLPAAQHPELEAADGLSFL